MKSSKLVGLRPCEASTKAKIFKNNIMKSKNDQLHLGNKLPIPTLTLKNCMAIWAFHISSVTEIKHEESLTQPKICHVKSYLGGQVMGSLLRSLGTLFGGYLTAQSTKWSYSCSKSWSSGLTHERWWSENAKYCMCKCRKSKSLIFRNVFYYCDWICEKVHIPNMNYFF